MRTILFSGVQSGTPIGTASWTDNGLVYQNDRVRRGMQAMVNRVGEEKAFEWFTDWSNGAIRSALISK